MFRNKTFLWISGIIIFLIVIGVCIFYYALPLLGLTLCDPAIKGLEFNELNEATTIEVYLNKYPRKLLFTTDSIEKVNFARKFIKNHPDGWFEPCLSPGAYVQYDVIFYDKGNHRIGEYGIGSNFLSYPIGNTKGWPLLYLVLEKEERKQLINTLSISETEEK
jgi:hypothetical protein